MVENNGNNGSNGSQRDDFWDLEKLVPKRKAPMRSFSTRPATVSFEPETPDPDTVGEPEEKRNARRLSFEHMFKDVHEGADVSYTPEGNRLIKRVTIKRSGDKYDFYGNFRKAALLYYDYKKDKCDYAPFFSYMPQYSQMNMEQKNYYFYWRSEIRRGKFPKTDYSYLYLFVYEILNLPDKIPAEEGIKLLCALWRAYRTELPKLGANFSVWVQDYCLIHRLPCPSDELRDFMFEVITASPLKEFYLSDLAGADDDSVAAMIAFLSDYDWRRGRFIEESVSESYKKYMLTAMKSVLLHTAECGELYEDADGTRTVGRNAFPNSLCTHSVKCRLEIEYVSLAASDKLRTSITAAVRYTENKIRAILGVKSRLSVKELPDKYKEIIDAYFTLVTDKSERIRAKEQIPEYERLYDAPTEKLSFVGADEIERASWATTKRLVVEDEDEEEQACEAPPEKVAEPQPDLLVNDADSYGLSSEDVSVLSRILNGGNTELDELATEAAVERINEAFADRMGDVILYHDGEKYTVYDDYTEEVGEWLLKLTR